MRNIYRDLWNRKYLFLFIFLSHKIPNFFLLIYHQIYLQLHLLFFFLFNTESRVA